VQAVVEPHSMLLQSQHTTLSSFSATTTVPRLSLAHRPPRAGRWAVHFWGWIGHANSTPVYVQIAVTLLDAAFFPSIIAG